MMRWALPALLLAAASASADVRLTRWSVMPAEGPPRAAETGLLDLATEGDAAAALSSGQVLDVVLVIENAGDTLEPGSLVVTEPLLDDLQYVPGSAVVMAGPAAGVLVSADGSHFGEPPQVEPPWRLLRWVWQEPVADGARIELRYQVRLP